MKVSYDGKRRGSWWKLGIFGGFGGKEKSEEEFKGKTCTERCEDDELDIHDRSPSEQWPMGGECVCFKIDVVFYTSFPSAFTVAIWLGRLKLVVLPLVLPGAWSAR